MKFASLRHSLGSKMAITDPPNISGTIPYNWTTDPNLTFNGTNASAFTIIPPGQIITSHNDIDTVKTHVQIAPNVYLKIIDEGGRAIFHLCENLLRDNLAGEFLPAHYKKNKETEQWQYYNYKCNKCGVMIPNELTNKADVMGQLAKFKTNNG